VRSVSFQIVSDILRNLRSTKGPLGSHTDCSLFVRARRIRAMPLACFEAMVSDVSQRACSVWGELNVSGTSSGSSALAEFGLYVAWSGQGAFEVGGQLLDQVGYATGGADAGVEVLEQQGISGRQKRLGGHIPIPSNWRKSIPPAQGDPVSKASGAVRSFEIR